MAESYAELLRDPRWQRKRLEVMGLVAHCEQEKGRLITQPYTTAASRRVEELDAIEDVLMSLIHGDD